MMLILAYSGYTGYSVTFEKWIGAGAVTGSILTGTGSALIYHSGFSFGTGIQITGMIIAEITAWAVIVESFIYHYGRSKQSNDKIVWWTVTIGLIGLSLATPLGHLAGAFKDFGEHFHLFVRQAAFQGLPPEDMAGSFIDSHSHQVLASFLAAGFSLPFLQASFEKRRILSFLQKAGFIIIITATIAQVALYQYCAWSGWDPPDLFAHGPDGLPLDDFILVILGLGMLLLLPAYFAKETKDNIPVNHALSVRKMVGALIIAYLIAVVALGLYIEFHETFFGHGEGTAPGVSNDLAYIRAHLLFGFMLIPILLGILLNLDLINYSGRFITGLVGLVAISGFTGVFIWTFSLDATALKMSLALTVILLLAFPLLLIREKRSLAG